MNVYYVCVICVKLGSYIVFGSVFVCVFVTFANYNCSHQHTWQHIHHDNDWHYLSIMASGGNTPGFPSRDQIAQLKVDLGSNLKQIQDLEWRLHQLTKTGPGRVVASQALVRAIQQNIQNLKARNSVIINHLDRIA